MNTKVIEETVCTSLGWIPKLDQFRCHNDTTDESEERNILDNGTIDILQEDQMTVNNKVGEEVYNKIRNKEMASKVIQTLDTTDLISDKIISKLKKMEILKEEGKWNGKLSIEKKTFLMKQS